MNETYATALINQARNLAAVHRYADAVRVLDTAEFREFAASSDHPDLPVVLADLAWWMAWSGRARDGLVILEEVQQRPAAEELPAQQRFVIRARHAYVVGISGAADTSQRAVALLSAIVADLSSEPDISVELRFHLRRQHARWIGTAGQPAQALHMLAELENEFDATIDHGSEEWLLLLSNLAHFSANVGAPTRERSLQAVERYEALVHAREAALGPKHPHTLDARRNHAWVLGQLDPATALARSRQVVTDATGVLDDDHRYVMAARLDMAVLASRLGLLDIVVEHVDSIIAAVDRAQSAIDVLSEYGIVEAPAAKLDEVAEFLQAGGDARRCDAMRAVRSNLLGL